MADSQFVDYSTHGVGSIMNPKPIVRDINDIDPIALEQVAQFLEQRGFSIPTTQVIGVGSGASARIAIMGVSTGLGQIPQGTTSATAAAHGMTFYVTGTVALSSISFNFGSSSVTTQHYDVGIYNTSWKRLWSLGDKTTASVTVHGVNISDGQPSKLSLTQGEYRLVWASYGPTTDSGPQNSGSATVVLTHGTNGLVWVANARGSYIPLASDISGYMNDATNTSGSLVPAGFNFSFSYL